MPTERAHVGAQVAHGGLVFLSRRLMSDQITPVLAYRRLVAAAARTAPSFLFESVETGSLRERPGEGFFRRA